MAGWDGLPGYAGQAEVLAHRIRLETKEERGILTAIIAAYCKGMSQIRPQAYVHLSFQVHQTPLFRSMCCP